MLIKLEREYGSTDAIYFPLRHATTGALVTGVTLDAGDMKLIKDGGASANVSGTFAEIGNGFYSYTPAAADLQCKVGTFAFVDAEAICSDMAIIVETYGDVNAQHTQTVIDPATLASASDQAEIKAKTDSLTFTVPNRVDANTKAMNDASVLGTGTSGDKWRGSA